VSVILFTLPASAFPTEDWLDKIWFDKWVHIGIFFILVILWCWALMNKYPAGKLKTVFVIVALIALVYGIGIEMVQHYLIPNRSFDGGDIIADAAGCLAALFFSTRRYIKK